MYLAQSYAWLHPMRKKLSAELGATDWSLEPLNSMGLNIFSGEPEMMTTE
jgi:hypothetical protein